MNYTHTTRYFYEPALVESGDYISIEDAKWELLTVRSLANLCDEQQDGKCVGDTYHTDSQWFMTLYCSHHFKRHIKIGDFKEIKNAKV